jgi:hypothetical protein
MKPRLVLTGRTEDGLIYWPHAIWVEDRFRKPFLVLIRVGRQTMYEYRVEGERKEFLTESAKPE